MDRRDTPRAVQELGGRIDLERPDGQEELAPDRAGAAVDDAVADADPGALGRPVGERGDGQSDAAQGPGRCRDGQIPAFERMPDLGLPPGDELAVEPEQGLDRERPLPRLDRSVLGEERVVRVAVDSDDRPIGLLAGKRARIDSPRRVPGDSLEERVGRFGKRQRLNRDFADAESGGGAVLRELEPDVPRVGLRERQVVAPAVAGLDGPRQGPRRAVLRELHVVAAGETPGFPLDRQAAELPPLPQIDLEPGRAAASLPGRRRIAVHRAGGLEARRGRGRREHRRMRRRPGRGQGSQRQIVERDPARSSCARRHRELDRGGVADLSASRRPPGEGEVAFLESDRGPGRRRLEFVTHRPPDVLAGRVEELDLQVVGAALPAEGERDLVVLRQVERHGAARRGPARAAGEIEIEPQRVAVDPLGVRKLELHARRRRGFPHRDVVEIVEDLLPIEGLRGRSQQKGDQNQQGETPVAPSPCPPVRTHSFTPPIRIPEMYDFCSARKRMSTGRTVSTEPAIISSVSWACSPERIASATGSV